MPELRKDPVTGHWVIFSPERKVRPQFYLGDGGDVLLPENCPFCEGNELMTPPEVYAVRDRGARANGVGWRLRVVPNKYPALRVEGSLDKSGEGFYDKMNGVGAHEVVIETSSHVRGLDELGVSEVAEIFLTFKRRILDLKRDVRFRYIQVFKNHGRLAGATIPHPHSQIVALPVVPFRLREMLDTAGGHFGVRERCMFCDIIHHEEGYGKRVLVENGDFIAIAPFASRLPFELEIYPRVHGAVYEDISDELVGSLAVIVREVVGMVNRVLEGPAYNLMLYNSPFGESCGDYFHWHIGLVPVLTGTGGFELGTYTYINPTPPEEVVEVLKGKR